MSSRPDYAARFAELLQQYALRTEGNYYQNRSQRIEDVDSIMVRLVCGTAAPDTLQRLNLISTRRAAQTAIPKTEQRPTAGWVPELYAAAERGHLDAAVDILFDRVSELMTEGRFEEVQSTLLSLDLTKFEINVLVGVLTSTARAADQLPMRSKLVRAVEARLRQIAPERADALIATLR